MAAKKSKSKQLPFSPVLGATMVLVLILLMAVYTAQKSARSIDLGSEFTTTTPTPVPEYADAPFPFSYSPVYLDYGYVGSFESPYLQVRLTLPVGYSAQEVGGCLESDFCVMDIFSNTTPVRDQANRLLPNIGIGYYKSLSKAADSALDRASGITSLEQYLLQVDQTLKSEEELASAKTTVGGQTAYITNQNKGAVTVFTKVNDSLYTVTFTQRPVYAELSSEEKEILGSLTFVN